MRSSNTYYTNDDELKKFLVTNALKDNHMLLIQVFTGFNDKIYIKKLLHTLTALLPHATIIGSTTDGEIMNGHVSLMHTVLSFTQFEHTTLHAKVVKHEENDYHKSARLLAESLIEPNTKLMIAFSDGIRTNGEAFLNGISSINKDIIVAGGLAGDNAEFIETFVFDKEHIISRGAVAVTLNSEKLLVTTEYSFNWKPIGKKLIVTKVEDNRIYEIDGRSAVDTYAHYLGQNIADTLPSIGVEFPLVIYRDGVLVARAVIDRKSDNSLIFAGSFREGDIVSFAYSDIQEILRSSVDVAQKIQQHPSEAIFIYSCMARRHFMPNEIESEIMPLQDIAPTTGFFTNGEFFTSTHPNLLNQTMTVVSLSESTDKVSPIPTHRPLPLQTKSGSSMGALTHLINVTSQEVEEQTEKLNQLNSNLKEAISHATLDLKNAQKLAKIGSWKLNIKTGILIGSDECYSIYAVDHKKNEEFTLSYYYTLIHPNDIVRVKANFKTHLETLQPFIIEYHIILPNGREKVIEERCETYYCDKEKTLISKGTVQDVSEKKAYEEKMKAKDKHILHQARLAEMGEMIGMIAHQWKQPLNILSMLTQDVVIKYEREKLNDEIIENFSSVTEEQIMQMSKTIDDFRNFFKPGKAKVDFILHKVIQDMISLMNPLLYKADIALSFEYDETETIILNGYPNEFGQVLVNIIHNAHDALIQSSEEKKMIGIDISQKEGVTKIKIFDNGGGIPEDIIHKVFTPYFSTKKELHGTGLGLYMVKMIIVDNMDGDIKVTNNNKGACFEITFGKADGGGKLQDI